MVGRLDRLLVLAQLASSDKMRELHASSPAWTTSAVRARTCGCAGVGAGKIVSCAGGDGVHNYLCEGYRAFYRARHPYSARDGHADRGGQPASDIMDPRSLPRSGSLTPRLLGITNDH